LAFRCIILKPFWQICLTNITGNNIYNGSSQIMWEIVTCSVRMYICPYVNLSRFFFVCFKLDKLVHHTIKECSIIVGYDLNKKWPHFEKHYFFKFAVLYSVPWNVKIGHVWLLFWSEKKTVILRNNSGTHASICLGLVVGDLGWSSYLVLTYE
jgi:hypothetical protein